MAKHLQSLRHKVAEDAVVWVLSDQKFADFWAIFIKLHQNYQVTYGTHYSLAHKDTAVRGTAFPSGRIWVTSLRK